MPAQAEGFLRGHEYKTENKVLMNRGKSQCIGDYALLSLFHMLLPDGHLLSLTSHEIPNTLRTQGAATGSRVCLTCARLQVKSPRIK